MLNNNAADKYETPFKGPSVITQFWTNDKVTVHNGAKQIRYNIHDIKPYPYDTNVEDI